MTLLHHPDWSALRRQGYIVPDKGSPARRAAVIAPTTARGSLILRQRGNLLKQYAPEYVDPDTGLVYTEARNGMEPVVVRLFRTVSPLALTPKDRKARKAAREARMAARTAK